MRKFIDSIIRLLINTVVIITLIALCFFAFLFIISKLNNTTIEDTLSYINVFDTEFTSSTSLDDSQHSNINLDSSNKNNSSDIATTNNMFYYNQLDEYSKLIYNELENNIKNLKKANCKIDFSNKFNDLLNQTNGQDTLNLSFQTALDAFFYDHPELFYIDITKISLTIKYTTIGPITSYNVYIEPKNGTNYLTDNFNSEEKVNEAISKVENVKNNLINTISNDSEYNKALTVHDALVNSLEYYSSNEKNNNTHNIYGALIERKVVCEGYAKAFKYVLDSLNIECILVSGTATNSTGETEAHMWNYIKLDENWYGVDVTWDDPIIIGGSSNTTKHNYFCKGINVFNNSHVSKGNLSNEGKTFKFPTLSNKDYK